MATAIPIQAAQTITNWADPITARASDAPSRRNAAIPSWIISIISSRAPAIQNVAWYTARPGPPSARSGVKNASSMFRTSFSSHSPAFHSPSIAAVHASAATFPAALPR